MAMNISSPFFRLPAEIFYHIIDYLDTPTILLTFSNICTYFRDILTNYNRYKLNFNSIGKSEFHRISRRIQPINIRSLTLSDDNKTPGQIRLFFSMFEMNQFIRLFSLTLIGVDEHYLNKILQSTLPNTLTSLSITWREAHCPSIETMNILSATFNQLNLQKLELKTSSYALEKMLWPIQYTLKYLTLMYITQQQYYHILEKTPNLKTLILHHCSLHKMNEDVETIFDHLTSLIFIDCRLSLSGLESILVLTPSLIYLKIIGLPDPFDSVTDGYRWEQFIRRNLVLLKKFEFFFTNIYNVYYKSQDIQLIISRFQTSFWLEEKQWYVTCDFVNYLNQVMFYTVPLCSTDFTYECQANKISYSTFINIPNDHRIIFENVESINLTLTKLIAGALSTRNTQSDGYLFPNIRRLTIDVDQEWSLQCIQHLSTIVNLSHVQKLTFNPDLNPQILNNTLENVQILLILMSNLNTLAIHPFSSYNGIINMDNICTSIPSHIKYLEVTIHDIDSMRIILKSHQSLWSLTLLAPSDRSMPWSEFIEELFNQNKDFVYWESFFSLHIWFSQTI